MFGVGLQFHVDELLAVRGVAVPGAILQCTVATVFGAVLANTMGWGWAGGTVFGIALAVASTVVVVRVLSDYNALHTPAGHIAVGWLVVEDIFTVLAIVLLPALFGSERVGAIHLDRRRAHRCSRCRRSWRSPRSSARVSFHACSIAWPPRNRASCSR